MSNPHSALLINEEPLQVLPSLALAITRLAESLDLDVTGLNEALVLQQLHYWLRKPKQGVTAKGRKWIYNSYAEWQENFPFWSERTVQRIFINLERLGLVIAGNLGGRDRRKWYAIDYEKMADIEALAGSLKPSLSPGSAGPKPPPESAAAPRQVGTMYHAREALSDAPSWHDASRQVGTMEEASPAPSARQVGTMLNKVSETTAETTRDHSPPAAPQPARAAPLNGKGARASKFSYEQRLAYARNRPGIDKPEGYANSKPAREGDFDEAIAAWYAEGKPLGAPKPRDTSACPDCEGKGHYFTDPTDPKTFQLCTHPRLGGLVAARGSP